MVQSKARQAGVAWLRAQPRHDAMLLASGRVVRLDAKKKHPRRFRQQVPPIRIEEQYAKALVTHLSRRWRAAYADLLKEAPKLAQARHERRDDFNPDEPRDEGGKWTGGGEPGSWEEYLGASQSKLDQEERDAIYSWSGRGYRSINSAARSGEPSRDPAVAKLDSAIAKNKIPFTVNVYRGANGAPFTKLKVGDTFTDNGFVATSAKDSTAEFFAREAADRHYEGAVFKITVPKGYPAMALAGQAGGEKEILLPRGTRFEVTDVQRRSAPHDVTAFIQVRVIPETQSPKANALHTDGGSSGARYIWGSGDVVFHGPRLDSPESRRAQQLVAGAAADLRRSSNKPEVAAIAQKFAERTSTYQRTQLHGQLHDAIGIDPDKIRDPDMGDRIDDFVQANVGLISRIPQELHGDVEDLVSDAVRRGRPAEDLADDIEERFGVAERHARLIARDQVGKLFADVNHARQRALGIRRFIWRTVQDERVRGTPGGKYPDALPSHFDLDGQLFSYDDPPQPEGADGPLLPGQDYSCRCYSEPYYDDVLGPDDDDEDQDDDTLFEPDDLDEDTDSDEDQGEDDDEDEDDDSE